MKKEKNISDKILTTKNLIEQFEMLFPMLLADLGEIRELSKKKPDGLVNTLKVKTINKKLEKIRNLLSGEPTIEFLELLDDETLPFNSDAVLLMVQYKSALKQFQDKYYTKDRSDFEDLGDHYSWKTSD